MIISQRIVPKNECFSSKIIAVTTSWPITGKKTITRNNIEFIKQPLLPDMVDSSPLSCIVISKSLSDSHHDRLLAPAALARFSRCCRKCAKRIFHNTYFTFARRSRASTQRGKAKTLRIRYVLKRV